MKKFLSIFCIFTILLSCTLVTTAFTVEPIQAEAETISSSSTINEEITPYGTLSGYGSHWYNVGESREGSFYVTVTGSFWTSAQVTFSIENFNSDTKIAVQLFRPDGSFAWGSLDNSGAYITMADADDWHNLKFPFGHVGTYRVDYLIINPSSGRINCWIY